MLPMACTILPFCGPSAGRADRRCGPSGHVPSSLDELRSLLARHARPDTATALADVLISRVEEPAEPSASMTGTVMDLIAQGAKHLALGERVYE